jgi:hypothetical protein
LSDIFAKVKHQACARPQPPARSEARTDGGGPSAKRLGNNTKSRAAFEARDSENPDCIQGFILDEKRREYVPLVDAESAKITARQARFSAQGSATKLLFSHETPRDTQWRVTGCSRRKIATEVAVLHSAQLGKAHFGNLMICGSVWTCPVCAAKISEGRKQEIKTATDAHRAAGGALYMITHTFSHQRCDDIKDLMKRFSAARQWMRSQRAYKQLRKDMGYVGDIRTLEVTYGDRNGWHPHEHGLWLVADPLTRVQLRRMMNILFVLWERACAKCGLGAPNRKRGVNIIECQSAADYMAKMGREQQWGIASELSKQHIKAGKADRMTAFDLLRSYEAGNKQHGALFIQYAQAFFGKRQIIWSDGLKAIFGILIREDQEIAEDEMCVDAVKVTTLTAYEWRVVLDQPFDVRSIVLQLAEAGQRSHETTGHDAVRRYIEGLVQRSKLFPF